MNEKTVYLSGAISNAPLGGRDWRRKAEEAFSDDVRAINPLDVHSVVEDGEVVEGPSTEHTTDADIVVEDKVNMDQSDILFVNWQDNVRKAGTPMEIIYCYERKKPIVVWHSDRVREELSPWVRYHATFMSEKFEACIDHIENYEG